MNTLENTVSMMKALPEADLVKIQDFIRKLSRRHELEVADEAVGKFLKPMSLEDFMRDIEVADKQFAAKEYQEMGEAVDEICRELGI